MTHQLEVTYSTINEFKTNESKNNFAQYLLGELKSSKKFINILIKNLTATSPMYRVFYSLNVIFILTILALTTFSLRSWIYPEYPNRVDPKEQMIVSREITPLKIKRQTFSPQSVNNIVSQNLFRKSFGAGSTCLGVILAICGVVFGVVGG